MSLTLRNAPVYAATNTIPSVILRGVFGYALVEPLPELPKGKTGYQAVKEMILANTTHSFPEGTMQIDTPTPSIDPLGNSSVLVTALPGSYLSGSTAFIYRRLPIGDALGTQIAQGAVTPSQFTDTHAMVSALAAASGINIVPADIVNLPISGGVAVIRAADESFFFVPGSEFSISS